MSREDHRRYDALLQQMRALEKPSGQHLFRGGIALWCLAGVMAIGLYLAPDKTPIWVCLGLLCMAALATHPVLSIPWVRRKHQIIRSLFAVFVMLSSISLYGWFVWPLSYYHKLTQREKDQFMAVLKSQNVPREELKITCPSNDEELCVIATNYLEMFQRSGWKTPDGGIERGLYGKSVPGISIAKKPQPGKLDPNNPDLGLWVLQSPSIVTIINAFESVHIKTNRLAAQDLPDNMIAIYFGPPPDR